MEQIDKGQKVILSFSHVPDIDVDGIEAMDQMVTNLRDHGIDIYIS
jgi:MFS superfamily sulfate permease-like transporter